MFNIFICDLFLLIDDIDTASYADDNTPYSCDMSTKKVIKRLEESTKSLLQWFSDNCMKSNADKSHFLLSSSSATSIKIGQASIQNSSSEKLLGIIIDKDLNFTKHATNICNKASRKFNALARVSNYMDQEKRRVIMKAFFQSQFGYCPLIWMFHSRALNNRINRLHERGLRIVYNNNSSFKELLKIDNSVTVHRKNLQILVTETFKWKIGISPELMNNNFQHKQCQYNLRNPESLKRGLAKTVHKGTETFSFLGPRIWNLVPKELKNITSLSEFKDKIKKWKPDGCPCRLCKVYIHQVGFI